LNLCPYNRFTFNDPNRVSLQALSQLFNRRGGGRAVKALKAVG
jgi:hypothetical protein